MKRMNVRNEVYVPVEERGNVDPRLLVHNGSLSLSRQVVVEALETFGSQGATRDEIVDLIGRDLPGDNPNMSAGRTLGQLREDGHVIEMRGRWYLTEHAPQPKNAPPMPPPNGRVQPVAPFVGKRTGKTVALYTTPEVLQNVIGLTLTIDNVAYKMPLFGNIRICIGKEAPQWTPEQEMYTHCTKIRVLLQGGQTQEFQPAYNDIVTIAPEE